MLFSAIFLAFTRFCYKGYLTNSDCQARARLAIQRAHPEVLAEWEAHVRAGGTFKIEGWLVYLEPLQIQVESSPSLSEMEDFTDF